jgi:hypothetical protein
MKITPNTVLLIGNDPYLQQTRAAVLRAAGAVVDSRSPKEAMPRIRARRYAVAVLCHTLSPQEAAHLLEEAHSLSPGTKVIQLVPLNNLSFESLHGTDAISNPEPAALASLVTSFFGPTQQKSQPAVSPGQQPA